jgi:hypothetical protein
MLSTTFKSTSHICLGLSSIGALVCSINNRNNRTTSPIEILKKKEEKN